MILNPNRMTIDQQQQVVDWLEANGCRDLIALEPITIAGNHAHYEAISRNNRPARFADDRVITKTRTLRIRRPLGHYLTR